MTWIQKMSLLWLAAAVLASAIPQPASAGAWAQPKGHLYTKLSSVFYRSDEVFDDAGHRQPTTIYGADFRADQGFLYEEYGLLERLTVITQLSGASLESENNIRHNVLRLTTSGGRFPGGRQVSACQQTDRAVPLCEREDPHQL